MKKLGAVQCDGNCEICLRKDMKWDDCDWVEKRGV